MSLHIYFNKEDVPKETQIIQVNDAYFNAYTNLVDTELTRKILFEIDQAEYVSPKTFLGRDKSLGALYKQYLSTGCKTLLNVVLHPNICFDTIECGFNALYMLKDIDEGNIIWERPTLQIRKWDTCDFICNGREFKRFGEFLKWIGGKEDVDDNSEFNRAR